MGYKILIKASGSSSRDLFKFYREPGINIDFEVDTIEELTTVYEELMEKYPKGQIIPVHKMKITLNTEIEDNMIDVNDEEAKVITNITVEENEGIISFIAEGENLINDDMFNWKVICDNSTMYNLASIGPTVELNEVQSSVYNTSDSVTVSISIGEGAKFFTVKE